MKTNSKNSELDEKVVKQRIVGKYGFVDQAEDNRYHRPIIKKEVSSRTNNNDYLKIYFNKRVDSNKLIILQFNFRMKRR